MYLGSAVFVLLVVASWWLHQTGSAFLVCWLGALFQRLVHSWSSLAVTVAAGYLVASVFIRSHFSRAAVLIVLVLLLPDVSSYFVSGCGEGFANRRPAESKRHSRLFSFRAKVAEIEK